MNLNLKLSPEAETSAVELLAEVIRAELEPLKASLEMRLQAVVSRALESAFKAMFSPQTGPQESRLSPAELPNQPVS